MTKHSEAPDWTYAETMERIKSIRLFHFRAFTAISYVGGLRINEARQFQPKNITMLELPGPRTMAVVRIPNEKNPYRTWKEMPINPIMEEFYYDHLTMVSESYEPESYPFQLYSERYYRKQIRMNLDIHPHALRHLRVHHIDDKTVPGMESLTPRQYQDYFGWETIATSSKYQSRTRSYDLAKLF